MSKHAASIEAASPDPSPVTSTVEVVGSMTIRTYSDGIVQRNVWDDVERAHEYAASVAEQEGS